MRYETIALEGAMLDHAVAIADGAKLIKDFWQWPSQARRYRADYRPTVQPAIAIAIFEREGISVYQNPAFKPTAFSAQKWLGAYGLGAEHEMPGNRYLEAGLRSFVRNRLGSTVEFLQE